MGFFDGLDRRTFMRLAATTGGIGALTTLAGPVLERAVAADPCGTGSLADIEHFVFLMMENRSFDHYFGTMSGVRGYTDAHKAGKLRQYGYDQATGQADPDSYLLPFRLDTTQGTSLDGECINDPTHNWGPQHQCWNNGKMDNWVPTHIANDGLGNGPAVMGYYTREDIPVHWALADAFTICDHYFCSVMGPTDPNRLYWISGTIDPEGRNGGPLLETPTLIPVAKYSWRTYPENLQEAGVSWKVYTSEQVPVASTAVLSGMLQSFKQTVHTPYLVTKGVLPMYPSNFKADVRNNRLPKVSWIVPPLINCEHPALPPSLGAVTILEVLDTLTANRELWEKTALILSYDENGGFYDHVPPPTAPEGTRDEWVTGDPLPSAASGIAGPVGLGFRVPAMVISPYSLGGLVSSDVFDHTSQLRLVEKRFGVEIPNLSAWRRETTSDMTSAFNFAAAPDSGEPHLKATKELSFTATIAQCKATVDAINGTFHLLPSTPYPVPANSMPIMETSPSRGRPSGPVEQCAPTATGSGPNGGSGGKHKDTDKGTDKGSGGMTGTASGGGHAGDAAGPAEALPTAVDAGLAGGNPSRIAGIASKMTGAPLAGPHRDR